MGRQLRFVVTHTKATREGLFQILASLDHRLCYEPTPPSSLGLLMPPEEVPGQFVSPQQPERHEDSDTPNVDVFNVTKRSAIERAKRHAQRDAEQLLLAADNPFGDVLEPVNPNLLSSKQPLQRRANGVADAEADTMDAMPAQHTVFADDDDGESQEELPEPLQAGTPDTMEEEPQNIQRTEAPRDGPQPSQRQAAENIDNGSNDENTTPESAVHPILKQKEELQLAPQTPITVEKSQPSERSEEKSKDKTCKSKHDKKRKRSKDEKEKHGTPSSKRKKKRRHSDSVLEVRKVEPKVESEGVHLGLTELKKKKKSKDKEKRKEKEKQKAKRGDKEKKKKEKHRSKEKRKRHAYDLSESYRESQQNQGDKKQSSSKGTASSQAGVPPEKKRKASDAKEKSESDDRERSSSQNHVLSTKYESALEAVNLAPLVSQESGETKSEPVRDGHVQFRTQVQGRVRGAVHGNGDVAVKTQRAGADREISGDEGKMEGSERGERERGKKGAKESGEEGSFRRGSQDKSERKKKKRKREKGEGESSERKKKKKSRHKHEAAEQKHESQQNHDGEPQREAEHTREVQPALMASNKVSALASALSRSLARKWHAR
ncbi:Vomeronasal type-1 receptor 4 [Gracilaria domingensis]|nr:Vomeronasal type-1 receptor 4 [Gracilaria domingensis]